MKVDRETGDARILDAVPHRNRAVSVEEGARGEAMLRLPLHRTRFHRPPFSWFLPVRDERRFTLDQLGREVWELCDGRRTVEQIADAFGAAHDLSFQEALVSVSQFLQTLTGRKLVAVEVREGGEGDAGA